MKVDDRITQFQKLKEELGAYRGIRSVPIWNLLREEFKAKYSVNAINLLDMSGFIVQWLNKPKNQKNDLEAKTKNTVSDASEKGVRLD